MEEKPLDCNDFLSDFVKETKDLILHGISINDNRISVSIRVFCCDVPAKSFILKVKGHSGFSSCTRCTIKGEYLHNRICFPYTKIHSTKRNHQNYTNITDDEYHIGSVTSNLIELPNFDSVSSFSLDYMHLVCLGVMKKLLMLWVSKGPVCVRIRSAKVNELSSNLLNLNVCITSDFVKKSRTLQELSRWKATEFRLFLLYTGPIILKKNYKQRVLFKFHDIKYCNDNSSKSRLRLSYRLCSGVDRPIGKKVFSL